MRTFSSSMCRYIFKLNLLLACDIKTNIQKRQNINTHVNTDTYIRTNIMTYGRRPVHSIASHNYRTFGLLIGDF